MSEQQQGPTAASAAPVERLNVTELGRLLQERRDENNLSIRQAAAEADISFSTFSRVEAGAHPDLATFSKLCAWLRISPGRFFSAVQERDVSPLEQAISHLRTDPRLSNEAARKISSVMRDLYSALAKESVPHRAPIACHLRAANVMRPGVPARLADLVRNLHDELGRKIDAGEL